jgi:hypothetical protein
VRRLLEPSVIGLFKDVRACVSEGNQQSKKGMLSKKIGDRKEEQKKDKFEEATFICIQTPPKTYMCLDGSSMHTIPSGCVL